MSTKIIKINRGDSYELSIEMTKYLDIDEVVYFAILNPNQRFEDALLIKGYTFEDQDVETNKIIVKIKPSDTKRLTPGVYYYTAKLQKGGTLGVIDDYDDPDEVRTIIERTKFIINE